MNKYAGPATFAFVLVRTVADKVGIPSVRSTEVESHEKVTGTVTLLEIGADAHDVYVLSPS